mgnify:CR=1 FL=1
MTRAEVNRSPGNVKQVPAPGWRGSIGADDLGHAIFEDVSDGCRCAIKTMVAKYLRGKVSVTQIISSWAPVSDGNIPSEYIKAVCGWTGFNDTQDLRLATRSGIIVNFHYFLMLMHAIEHYEAGKLWVLESDWLDGMTKYYRDFIET